jgi:hypothetical protein
MDFKVKKEVVTFHDGDGQVIGTVTVAKARLQNDQIHAEFVANGNELNQAEADIAAAEGRELTINDLRRQQFRVDIYPGLLASTIDGDIPDEETAWNMPAEELYKWYGPAHEFNPDYFKVIDEIADAYRISQKAGKAAEKKSGEKQPG